MPAKMERALKSAARRKFSSKKRQGRYVYGTMRKLGWTPKKR